MPVSLAHIRSELLPGLFDVRGSYDMIPRQWDKVFAAAETAQELVVNPLNAVVPLPAAVAMGVAAAVVSNPVVSRSDIVTGWIRKLFS